MSKAKRQRRANALARKPKFRTRADARAVGETVQDHPALRAAYGKGTRYSSTSTLKPGKRTGGRNRKVRRGA